MGLADHSDAELRDALEADGIFVPGDLSHEDLVAFCEEEGIGESMLLISGPAPTVLPSPGSEVAYRGDRIAEHDLPDLDAMTRRGVVPQAG